MDGIRGAGFTYELAHCPSTSLPHFVSIWIELLQFTQDCSVAHDTAVTGSQWGHSKLLWLASDHFYDTTSQHQDGKMDESPIMEWNEKQSYLNHNAVFTWRAFCLTPTVTLQGCFNCYSNNVTLQKWCTPWPLLLTLNREECGAKAYMQLWMSELPRTQRSSLWKKTAWHVKTVTIRLHILQNDQLHLG